MGIQFRNLGMGALLGATLLAGCGGGSARCDLRPSTPQCTDWRGQIAPVWVTQEAVCKTLG
ncbi:MAG TPA: hypothetical protein PKI03_27975, partial [Pseudomonadota bacterium]|nr:hypothetical protein [Pseudomonadota bacterium]